VTKVSKKEPNEEGTDAARRTHDELMRQLDSSGGRSSPALPPGLDAPKKRFKTAARAGLVKGSERSLKTSGPLAPLKTSLDAETEAALDLVAQRDGERMATLRSRRVAAAKEVSDAEHALLRVKTAVEDAEAIYNDVRADIAAGHHQEGAHHDEDEAHAEDDWDKYLHFGENHGERLGDDAVDDDEKTPTRSADPAAAAAAAAAAAEAMAEADASPGGGPAPVQSPEAAAAMQTAVAAAVRVESDDPQKRGSAETTGPAAGPGPGAAGAADADAAAARGLRGGVDNPNHHRFQPSLAEAEQFLLSELKKLEAANARLMSARHALNELDRQLGEATARAEANAATAARRRALAHSGSLERDGDDGIIGDGDGILDDEDVDEDVERREKTFGTDGGSLQTAAGPSGNGAAPGAPSAARRSSAAGGGGKVIEDRRFGIYDSRRYRMEGEPAPPDPSDDEDAAGRSASVRGRGASADAGKKKGAAGSNAEKDKSTKTRSLEKEKDGKNKKGGSKAEEKKKRGVSAGVSADAEARPGRAGGRGAGAGGRGGGRTGSTGRRIEPASASQLRAAGRDGKHAGFRFKKDSKAKNLSLASFAAPSAADAATYVARGGGSLRWRMKRPRTRSAVGRPATGPTSWAATCAFALWRGGELAAAKRASAARAAEEGEDEDEDTQGDDDSDSDSDKNLSDADSEERRAMFENARADAASPGFGLGDGWVEDDIVFDQFDHFDELAADDDGVVDIGAVMDLGFDE